MHTTWGKGKRHTKKNGKRPPSRQGEDHQGNTYKSTSSTETRQPNDWQYPALTVSPTQCQGLRIQSSGNSHPADVLVLLMSDSNTKNNPTAARFCQGVDRAWIRTRCCERAQETVTPRHVGMGTEGRESHSEPWVNPDDSSGPVATLIPLKSRLSLTIVLTHTLPVL